MATNHRKTSAATQTVKIDREAFATLEKARQEGESFSAVIKRCVRPKVSAEEILKLMEKAQISDSTLNAIEESVARRRRVAYKSKG
jgi:predicted CopG family antitoxin